MNRKGASQVVLVLKNAPASVGDTRDAGSIPGLGRSPGGGHGNPLQYSCLENPMDGGARWATVHRVAESDMTEVTEHAHMHVNRKNLQLATRLGEVKFCPSLIPQTCNM